LFTAVSSYKSCPARCASAANTIRKDIYIFRKQLVTLNQVSLLGISSLLLVSFCIGLLLL
jgi:hypothetical protein